MSETIGFVGVGMQGGAIARLSADAGYQVLVSNSRGPETLTDLVAELGEKARAVTAREAIESSDIVVLSVPMSSCKSLPMAAFAGKIVVDTLNYYPERDGTIEELESPALTSGEYLQREMPKGRIVKTLNNVDFVHLY